MASTKIETVAQACQALNPSVCIALVAQLGSAKSAEEVERAVTAIREYWKRHLERGGPGVAKTSHVPVSAR